MRGGARKGAGRKPGVPNKRKKRIRAEVWLSEEQWSALDGWANENEIKSRSKAVRAALELFFFRARGRDYTPPGD